MKITDPVAVLALDLFRIWHRAFCEQGTQAPRSASVVHEPNMTVCLKQAAAAIGEINRT